MKVDEFIAKAKQQISNNPLDRVSENIRNIKDIAIYDPHCHIFDKQCLPAGYFVLRTLTKPFINLVSLNDTLTETLDVANNGFVGISVEDLYKNLSTGDTIEFEKIENDIFNNIKTNEILLKKDEIEIQTLETDILSDNNNSKFSLQIIKKKKELRKKTITGLQFILNEIFKFKSNEEIFNVYLNQFSIKNLFPFSEQNLPFITGILMMDVQPGWEFKRQKRSFEEQMDEILKLTSKSTDTDNPIVPFFAVDPRRIKPENDTDLLDLFLKGFPMEGTSFFGVKIYPCLGYLPSDARLKPIFEICESKNIPIVSHCGGSLVSTFERKTSDKLVLTQNFDANDKVEIEFSNNNDMGDFLNQPEHWLNVLKIFPKLKINIAHFGSPTTWNESKPKEIIAIKTNIDKFKIFNIASRRNTIIALMKQFEGVYSDFSYNITEKNTFDEFFEVLNVESIVKNRTMFGTDFWVVLSNTLLFKDKLNESQKLFIKMFKNHEDSLFKTVPNKFWFEMLKNDIVT